ncbi:hypothetical protein NPX13_g4685 [Xylaria arbuscula]|uniref:VIT domain-containing protein n=1 Tax=Xylaria arbuscula TaxID=114810 RepID=A0A9W8NF23_9PEZI|nr:hypothetical protein NPX13_g4685 [Xylaria arbuscula]
MSIFSAGIVWDPREPLPADYYAASPSPVTNLAVIGEQKLSIRKYHSNLARAAYPPTQTRSLPSAVVQEADRNVLPAVSVSIVARITGDIAEVTVRQLFWNDADSPIEKGSYTFSLPNNCTVTGFTCRIGNSKVLKAIARPKAEAQEEFQRAIAAHRTAALLDQNTTEIFTSSIGNIPPNTRINAEITYATILKRRYGSDTNTTTLTIPTYIANRYGQLPASLEDLDLGAKPEDISLRIEVSEAQHIHSIQSTSHQILVDRGTASGQALGFDQIEKAPSGNNQETGIVTLKHPTKWMETDFVLSLDTTPGKGEESPKAWLEIHPSFENQAAIMVTIPPQILPVQKETSKVGEIIFVADRSGSMEDKMTNLRSAMHFFLKGIPVGRTFNIWCFGSNYECLWNKSRVYDEESLRLALHYVDSRFHANMGGTEILPALEAVVAARDGTLPCDVILLTDGEVWRLDETLDLVRKARNYSNGAIRFFSLGLGAHVSHALVEGIAREGGGYSEVIPQAGTEGWEARMIAVLKAALTPHLSDLRLDLNKLKAMTAPTNLQNINPFQAHRIFILLEEGSKVDSDKISLTFSIEGKRTSVDALVTRMGKPGTLIHSLSARAILDEFEREVPSASHLPETYLQTHGKKVEIQSLAEGIACKYTLPSRWTSLFLEHQDDKIPATSTRPIALARIEHGSLQDFRGTVQPVDAQYGLSWGASSCRHFYSGVHTSNSGYCGVQSQPVRNGEEFWQPVTAHIVGRNLSSTNNQATPEYRYSPYSQPIGAGDPFMQSTRNSIASSETLPRSIPSNDTPLTTGITSPSPIIADTAVHLDSVMSSPTAAWSLGADHPICYAPPQNTPA